jgi:hypothetical protein
MEIALRFSALLSDVLSGLMASGWVPAALLLMLVLALGVRAPWQGVAFRRLVRLAGLLLLLPIALTFMAAVFANESPYRPVSAIREQFVFAVFVVNVLLAVALVWAGRMHWLRAVPLALTNIWLAVWSALVSVMSLTGNWL